METLSTDKRAAILRCLIEGNSILSTARITGAAKNTIVGLLQDAGEACAVYQDRHMANLPCRFLQLDEIWSFVGCKERTKESAKREHPGDVWTWTSLCADSKLIPCWRIGDRSSVTAMAFCEDLAPRFSDLQQITTDGHSPYLHAIASAFGDIGYARLVKIYGKDAQGMDCVVGCRKESVFGDPDLNLASTSYVERSNLTIRMTNRRFTRLTNAFSKKLERHHLMMALTFMSYNYCRKHATLKETPAQAAGIARHRWTYEELIHMVDARVKEREDAAFERAFADKASRPAPAKFYEPGKPKTPWYLDAESGGPSPAPKHRKAHIAYADET